MSNWNNNGIVNAGQVPAIASGNLADIPAYNIPNMLFVSMDTFALYANDGAGFVLIGGPGSGTITGSGTAGKLTKWTGATTIGDSIVSESGAALTVAGTLTATQHIVPGGLATEFLKADGSLDSNSYLVSSSINGTVNYVPKFTSSNTIGNSNIQSNSGVCYITGYLSLAVTSPISPLAVLQVGNRNVLNSSAAQILVGGFYDNTVPTNGHAFADNSELNKTSGYWAYASFDGRVNITGAGVGANHYVSFQAAPSYSFTGTMDYNYGVYTTHAINNGTIANNYGIYIANPQKTGSGVVTINYGLYIETQNAGSTNYSIYSVGGFNYLAGALQVDSTITANYTGANIRLKGGGAGTTDGGLYVNGVGNFFMADWDGTRGFVTLGNGNGYYFGGNFGVKTATPSEALEVVGNAKISGRVNINGATDTPGIELNVIGAGNFTGLVGATGGFNSTAAVAYTTTGRANSFQDVVRGTNTTADLLITIEGNTPGVRYTGATAFACIVGSASATNLEFGTSDIIRGRFTSTGELNLLSRLNINGIADNATYSLNIAGGINNTTGNNYFNSTSGSTSIGTGTNTYKLNVQGGIWDSDTQSTLNQSKFGVFGGLTYTATGTETNQYLNAGVGSAYVMGSVGTFTPRNDAKQGAIVASYFLTTAATVVGIQNALFSNCELSSSGTITTLATLRAGQPAQYNGGSAFTGTITNMVGLYIDDISGSSIAARFTNKYGIYQEGTIDKNFFGGEIILGAGQVVSASVLNTVTNKVKFIVGGTTYYFLASTSAT